ncbi:uncharacterized protein LOC126811132 [Patella vulgata]|uniref:uncharacterized protein LOC126811132 n=1 Tax=Patella vulgata TaxID=6465 RepID=UPI00217FE427|nr:uncharacterized protein LOC126811132 [Patella vulgata]XP_055954457.1 uncharacterized protein LOC126811132 [Patella vulgata]
MADNAEIGYIIGGSVGGLIVFIAIVSLIIYMLCGPRNKRRRQEKKFHHLTRHPEQGHSHSQASTMSHISGDRLPKVGSNGVWVGTPGVYANPPPSSAYFYGRPYPPGVHRASSEARLPPAPFPGHAVYQSNNNNMSNLRIYHSQQLSPVYEYIDPTHGPNVVDIYQYGDMHHSKSRLIEQQPSSSWKKQKEKRDGKKVSRSKSDATQEQRRHAGRKRTDTNKSAETKSSSRSSRSREAKAEVHNQKKSNKSKSVEAIHTGYDNKAFQTDSGLATDSMKLQASKVKPVKNITDDEKQVFTPSDHEGKEDDPNVRHYVYEGDVYAVPEKNLNVEESDNPILAKMDSMVRDKKTDRPAQYLIEDEVDNATAASQPRAYTSAKSVSEPVYADIDNVTSNDNVIVTEVIQSDEVVRNTEKLEKPSNTLLQPIPSTSHNLLSASPSLLSDRSEISEDLDVKGKNVTTAAFQFLENYLSDEEDQQTEDHSRPTSPMTSTLHTDQGMY